MLFLWVMIRLLPQGIVCFVLCFANCQCLQTFYSEIILKSLKNIPSLKAEIFSPEPEVLVAKLINAEAVSIGDKAFASDDEAAAKSNK